MRVIGAKVSAVRRRRSGAGQLWASMDLRLVWHGKPGAEVIQKAMRSLAQVLLTMRGPREGALPSENSTAPYLQDDGHPALGLMSQMGHVPCSG